MNGTEKMRAFYRHEPNAPIYLKEFGYYCLDKWKKQGYIDDNTDLNKLFGFDHGGIMVLKNLGWCEAEFEPGFTNEVIEDRGEYEVVRDNAGRHVLYFKGRRNGFMPSYIDHPVKDWKTWEEDVKWRLSPDSEKRAKKCAETAAKAKFAQDTGAILSQHLIGGYMYLRSLIGPEELLYAFYDEPELVHDCMQSWLTLSDKVIAMHQETVQIDELFIAEDICYNASSLISPHMIREFLFPYYQQLITNVKSRQKQKNIFLQVDTDGKIDAVLDLYKSIGFNYFSPFEVASGCDVVATRKAHPDILIQGGFDKRILAAGKDAIDREVDRIMPFMKEHGGYIPTCDHGVPEEVEFEDYLHFRKRLQEFSN